MSENLFSTESVFSIRNEEEFNILALRAFHFQYENNKVYHNFCRMLEKDVHNINHFSAIPCLPVDVYRKNEVGINCAKPQLTFETSGTTGQNAGKHNIPLASDYQKAIEFSFNYFFGTPDNYCFLFLLPSYLERPNSSLVYMAEFLAKKAPDSGFYLYNHEDLYEKLLDCKQKKQKTILLGVTFALLDFAEKKKMEFHELIVIETGGMKGRREEINRETLHKVLKTSFGVENIGSEYGMTELLSQAYSTSDGLFQSPPWMKILGKDFRSPLYNTAAGIVGKLAIIDLAATNSCPFIQTDDMGRVFDDGKFTVQGRSDFSVIRGCNLLI